MSELLGSGNEQRGPFAPVTIVQSESTRPEEPFFGSGNVAYRQGFIGSATAQDFVLAGG